MGLKLGFCRLRYFSLGDVKYQSTTYVKYCLITYVFDVLLLGWLNREVCDVRVFFSTHAGSEKMHKSFGDK